MAQGKRLFTHRFANHPQRRSSLVRPLPAEIDAALSDSTVQNMSGNQPAASATKIANGGRWVIAFIIAAYCFQLGIFFFGDTALRMPLRIGVFGLSILFLVFLQGRGDFHPVVRFVPLIFLVLLLNLLNPGGAGFIAGAALVSLYVAVLAPFVWIAWTNPDIKVLRIVIMVMWIFYSASAVMGAVQVKYPGRFDGALSMQMDDYYIGAMTITMADGTKLLRPKGLTDVPGGTGEGGVYSIILGVGLLLTGRSYLLRGVVLPSMIVDLFSIYLSHGRAYLLIVIVAVFALMIVLGRRGMFRQLSLLAAVGAIAAITGTSLAFAIGGEETANRWALNMDDNSANGRSSQYQNMVANEFSLYPFGAGGGRWGMMCGYFGDTSKGLYAEAQWEAMLYDGGVALIFLYILLLFTALRVSWKIAVQSKDNEIGCWAAVVFGVTLSTVAASFVFPIYVKESGLEVFLLNALLFAVAGQGGIGEAVKKPRRRRIRQTTLQH